MKLNNKFFWMKMAVIAGIGFLRVMACANTAQALGVPIKVDPRLYVAEAVVSQAVPQVKNLSDSLWNNEVKAESKNIATLDFENKDDFTIVKRTKWDDLFAEYREQVKKSDEYRNNLEKSIV